MKRREKTVNKEFNLIKDPWIKVIDKNNREQEVSLIDFFNNVQDYRQLAGEMKSQDLAVFRFFLAILTTVYSRFDHQGQIYDWLELDENWQVKEVDQDDFEEDGEDDLLETWKELYDQGHFSDIVGKYLLKYTDHFNFFGEHPFYQVTLAEYNDLVRDKNKLKVNQSGQISGGGQVALKQINRTISESNNTPDIFDPRSQKSKNQLTTDALVRWLISYQNFTGVTDKSKLKTKNKFSVSKGWLFGLNPIFVEGKNLFETLLLNLKLFNEKDSDYSIQKPNWEYKTAEDYVLERKRAEVPDNIAALYTIWARMLFIDWESNQPIIYSAGLPKLDNSHAFIEPMTTWYFDKKDSNFHPRTRNLHNRNTSMWRHFGDYVDTKNESNYYHQPGIMSWIAYLKNHGYLPHSYMVNMMTINMIKDNNATSQSPAFEVSDEMRIDADVLFDQNPENALYWPARIEEAIKKTQTAGKYLYHFARNVGDLRDLSSPNEFAARLSARFYEELNRPFLTWLASLRNDEERDPKLEQWYEELLKIAKQAGVNLMVTVSPQDVIGKVEKKQEKNIFTFYNWFKGSLLKLLKEGEN